MRLAYTKGYRATESGDVISPLGCSLKLYRNRSNGYLRYTVYTNETKKSGKVWVHRFVAYCKYGELLDEDGIEVRHLNGNQQDNTWDNIAIGTRSENMMDRPKSKRQRIAHQAASVNRKLTDDQVREFRADREEGATYRQLMEKYHIAQPTVHKIINKKTYANVH